MTVLLVTLPKGAIVKNGTETKALGNNINVTFRQRTSWDDEPLQGDYVYRIIATFRVYPRYKRFQSVFNLQVVLSFFDIH